MNRLQFAWPIAILLSGCMELPTHGPWRGPNPEEILEKELDIGNVGDVTEVANGGYIQVSGVGLVTGLDGTGGTANGQYRDMLGQQLRKLGVENSRALIDSPNNALVLVTAFLPAGVRKGETIDVEIVLPEGSRATSLKGGFLTDTPLRNHELTSNLSENKGTHTLVGHVLAKAKGPLLVGLGNLDEPKERRRARVWSGGTSAIERPFFLSLTKDDKKSSKVTNAIAQRINRQFQDDPKKQRVAQGNRDFMLLEGVTQQLNGTFETGGGSGELARAANKEVVTVRVPYAYRYNHERFLRVARLLPLADSPEQMLKYRQRLETLIVDPKYTMRAALRLEALGKESVPTLRRALLSSEPMVRFCAAESLTYLGSTAGVEDLAKLAVSNAELRAYALIALASLDEAICRNKLGSLMTVDDPQLRAGAFRALRLLDENDPRLNDEPIANQFFLHRLAPQSEPLVLFSMHKRAEVVMFGPEIRVNVPVKILAGGEFTVTAERDDDRITVSRVTVRGTQRKQCGRALEDVIRGLADLGAGYAEVIDLLKSLEEARALPCPVQEVAPPAATGIETLAGESKTGTKIVSE